MSNSISGSVGGNVVQARDIYNYSGARPRTVSAKRFVAPDFTDRDAELAEISAFCRGEQGYAWWVGEPWSGKTALAAQVATQPPDGVDVVSFFVSRADGVYRLGDYVAALTVALGMGDDDLDELWEQAARRSAAQGRSLLLVVDGLDENRTDGEPSVASQLPIECPQGSHVLVTSRPHPDLPDDVRDGHPLRSCPRRTLIANTRAMASHRAANLDLKEHLRDPAARRVLGLLAVARGPLTADDLGAITGDFYETETLLTEALGRLLNPGYTLAHETLLTAVISRLGERYLDERLAELHAWAERHADWPAHTPVYLLHNYHRLLVETGDGQRLAALCTASRFRLLRTITGADYLTIRELLAAEAAQREVGAAARLALWIDVLNSRRGVPPVQFPALLARHGRLAEAEYIARELLEPVEQACALSDIATTVEADEERRRALAVEVDELRRHMDLDTKLRLATALSSRDVLDHAVRAAASITDDGKRASALARCAWTAAAVGTIEDVRRIGVEAGGEDKVAIAMVAALARAGRPAEAETLLKQSPPSDDVQAAELVSILAYEFGRLGDLDAVDRVLAPVDDPVNYAKAMVAFVKGIAPIAEPDDIRTLLADLADTNDNIEDPYLSRWPLREIAAVAATSGHVDLALDVATRPGVTGALLGVVRALTDADGASEVALTIAEGITDRRDKVAALIAVAVAMPDLDRSRELLAIIDRVMADNLDVADAAISLAALAASHGQWANAVRLALHAEQFASREPDEGIRRYVMARVVRVLTAAEAELQPGQLAWVEQAAGWLADQSQQHVLDYAILEVLTTVLPLLDTARATSILLHLGTGTSPEMVAEVVRVADDAGRGELTTGLELPEPQPLSGSWQALQDAARLRESGAHDEAERVLRVAEDAVDPAMNRTAAVEIAIALGERSRAADLAAAESNWPLQHELLAAVARSMVTAGEHREAEPLVVGLLAAGDLRILDIVADIDPDAISLLVDTFTEIVDYLSAR